MSKVRDLTGQSFGRWIVEGRAPNCKKGNARWKCKCSCGAKREVQGYTLKAGKSTSCGCISREISSPDISGQKFNKLKVIKRIGSDKNRQSLWECLCDCGNTTQVIGSYLKAGHTKSCGCLLHHALKHGKSGNSSYNSWRAMKARCLNPNSKGYERYGGRGISVCDEWIDEFAAFDEYMGARPEGTTLERLDSNGNYEPGNCCWATPRDQMANRGVSYLVEYNGKVMMLEEAIRQSGRSHNYIKKHYPRVESKYA